MNLVHGEGGRIADGLGRDRWRSVLSLPDSVLAERPGAPKSYVGKDVAVGVRSEDMEDGTLVNGRPADRRIKGQVALTEALGSQIIVHFTFAGRPSRHRGHQAYRQGVRDRGTDRAQAGSRREVGRVVRTSLQGQDGR